MSEGYFVDKPFGLIPDQITEREAALAAERRKEIWSATFHALESHASMHIGTVTEIVLMTLSGQDESAVEEKMKFFQGLSPHQKYAVSRFLVSMTKPRYHRLFPSPI
ncbi:MAG: hypothetical protein NTW50_05590 [Candidatus Berkelbacteria bacterium]|nr:hypothetical protein [Candidatus Berkelbacteria bacterium]